jgi:uncharacterized membrane protein YgcG
MNGKNGTGYVVAQVVMIVLFLVTAFVIAVFVPGDAKTKLTMSIGYGLLVLAFLFGMVILVEIIRGNIDLSGLLSEDGKASMSRFQLLIFTFVIALSLFLMVAENGTKFPDIPANVLTLLGISASTYAVSKGIQAGSKPGSKDDKSGGGGASGGSGNAPTT